MGPVEVEQFITFPVENAMSGLPRVSEIRSISRIGLSAVTVAFEDGTDIYWARNRVNERLQQARERIPAGMYILSKTELSREKLSMVLHEATERVLAV